MKRFFSAAAAVVCLSAPAAHAITVDEIYVFGDSLNDCCINPAAPFTNGPETWLVEFAALLGASYAESTTYNYATGGAQSGDYNAIAPGGAPQPNGLQSQIDLFEGDAPAVDSDDLAVIWVGTNDIWASSYDSPTLFGIEGLDIVKPLGEDPSTGDLTDYIIGNLQDAVIDLREAGFGTVLLLTPYDIGDSALVDSAGGSAQNTAYSEALSEAMLALYTPGIDTFVLDTVALIRSLQDGSPENGFTELTTAPSCTFGEILCETRTPPEQDSFIYYDFVHLTRATNREVAMAAADLLQNGTPVAPVPLPAGGLLLLSAAGGLLLLRRRAT
ncbi:GDSL-type esterase/lipase family protein [Ovoidimarina sediminis]|uniref:GDSL-type esterase/lipase family protein n=1 Tax=Ovoidimarina sediminis TaxID=3079856 RepID=UPI002907BEAD|nr:GDSL-type esterase/lipase family protein [Rhodophyticola sp. MJ-SS7]MDU8944929.1 SGNH/GDSL hydrolase family protein [Rhodophyticola sp. MJ-SS7]